MNPEKNHRLITAPNARNLEEYQRRLESGEFSLPGKAMTGQTFAAVLNDLIRVNPLLPDGVIVISDGTRSQLIQLLNTTPDPPDNVPEPIEKLHEIINALPNESVRMGKWPIWEIEHPVLLKYLDDYYLVEDDFAQWVDPDDAGSRNQGRFLWQAGNYSCDCNRSSTIVEQCPAYNHELEDMGCGSRIKLIWHWAFKVDSEE